MVPGRIQECDPTGCPTLAGTAGGGTFVEAEGRRVVWRRSAEGQSGSALVLKPQLLLLDEPFSALDPPTRSRLLEDLSMLLNETDTTTVFVTHDLNEAVQLAGHMAVIVGNRLRQVGSPEEVFAMPQDQDVAQFINHRSSIDYRQRGSV